MLWWIINYASNRWSEINSLSKFVTFFACLMSEDKMVTTESESVNTVADIESEISAITNDTNSPYWNKSHPDHDKMVQQVYTLREMLNADK